MLLLLYLLCARGGAVLEGSLLLLLLLMRVLMTIGLVALLVILRLSVIVPVLKSKHLRWLFIVEHMVVVLQLMRHLSVHLGSVLIGVLDVVVLSLVMMLMLVVCVAFGGGVAESVSSCVGALHSV